MDNAASPELYRCAQCGIQSTIKEAFILTGKKGSGPANSSVKAICFECQAKQSWRSHLNSIGFLLLLGGLMYLLPSMRGLGRFYLLLCAGLVLSYPLIVLHELAHALTASLLGMQVFAIYLGAGETLFTRRWLGLRWFVRPLPIGGATLISGPEQPLYRLRLFLIYLAGPGFHALVALLAIWALPALQGHPLAATLTLVMMWANLLLFIVNLTPRKVSASTGITGTDGWKLFHIFGKKPEQLAQQQTTYYTLKAMDAADREDKEASRQAVEAGLRRFPADPGLINTAGYVYSLSNDYAKAREAFLKTLNSPEGRSEGLKFLAMNNVAFADLMLEDPALQAEADQLSAQAHQNYPWEPNVGGTRGAVLVWLGRVEEGIPLMKAAMARSYDRRGKALDACLIARGEARRGNLAEARKYLAAARELGPQCILLEKVGREIEQEPGSFSAAQATA